jgi:hypothetical protein
MPQHRTRPQTRPEETEEDVIKEDSGPPSPAPPASQPAPRPDDKPVAVDPDDAMIEEPKDDAFKDTKPKPGDKKVDQELDRSLEPRR